MDINTENKLHIIGKLDTTLFDKYFGRLQIDEVIITDERIAHIKKNHPHDYALFVEHGQSCLTSPDWIITDEKNEGTVFIIKKLENTNVNIVLRLALQTDESGLKNSVMTFWRIRDKNIKKLANKNKILYKNS